MKSAEVSAGAEILASIYLFFGELSAGTFGCGFLGLWSFCVGHSWELSYDFASRSQFLIRDNQDQICEAGATTLIAAQCERASIARYSGHLIPPGQERLAKAASGAQQQAPRVVSLSATTALSS
jgi:hypothetical protein